MESVISASRIDNVAVGMLTPVLAILCKFGSTNAFFRSVTKSSIFPSSRETHFQSLVAEEQKENGRGDGNKRIVAPLDAPADTFQGKLVRLLTWPNTNVKRFVGELLWALCDGNSNEFISRVGMGNALPILNLKGVVNLPAHLSGEI